MKFQTRETVTLPKTWEELFQLQGFVHQVSKDLMKQGKLIWDYEMDPKTGLRPCGIQQCLTNHRHGYVVALPDGRIGHIGRVCGKTHFDAEWTRMKSTFSREKREYTRTIAIREQRAQLARRIAERPILENDETLWARALLSSFDQLPADMRATLESRSKQGDASILGWRDETEAEMRQRKFHAKDSRAMIVQKRIQVERGPLIGLPGIRPDRRVDALLDKRLPTLLEEARHALEDTSMTADNLNALGRRLDALPKEIESSVRQLTLFVSQQNLNLLLLLQPVQKLGIRRVEYAPGPPPTLSIER